MQLSKEDFLSLISSQISDRKQEIEKITTHIKEAIQKEVHSAGSSVVDKQGFLEKQQLSFKSNIASSSTNAYFLCNYIFI